MSLPRLLFGGAGYARELFALVVVFKLLKSVSACRPSVFFLLAQKEGTKKEGTPRPRLPRVVRGKFPAVLTKRRPLRNSHVHVLEHARFPLRFAPLLGAPEGPHFPFDPASCLVFEASSLIDLLDRNEAKAAERASLRARRLGSA